MNTTATSTAALRHREAATAAMVADIERKIVRLDSARRERAAALERIRFELARALERGPVGPEHHEN